MAQSAQKPALDNQHRGFDFRLVARPARPSQQDRGVVMRRHLGVAAIDLRLVKAGLDDRDFGVVRHQQPGHAADGGKGSHVGSDPIAEPLRPARFRIEPAPAKAGVKLEAPSTATKICAGRVSPLSQSMITGTVSPA